MFEKFKKGINITEQFLGIFGWIILVVVFVVGIYIKQWGINEICGFDIDLITFISVIAIAASFVAIGISAFSEKKMIALTNLNFDEKMAMMTSYKNNLEDMKEERDKIEDILNNKKEIEEITDAKERDSLIKNKRWQEQCSEIRAKDWLMLEYKRDKKIGKKMEVIIKRCKYDLSAISHLRTWATSEKKKDLIECVINVIKSAKSIDTCGNNRGEICKIINIGLDMDPNNVDLQNFYKENRCRNA